MTTPASHHSTGEFHRITALAGSNVVRTLLNSSVDKTYLHGARGPEYERTGTSSPVWYLYDGLGSVLGTVNSSGTIINTRKYDVYGAVRASTGGTGPKHKFVGTLGHPSDDETGLIYMRARYCDPICGRFTSEDPAGDGINWFVYVDNNPVLNTDFTGKFVDAPYNQAVVTGALCGVTALLAALAFINARQIAAAGSLGIGLSFAKGADENTGANQNENEFIDRVCDTLGLDRAQRGRLHGRISRKGYTDEEIWDAAGEILEQGKKWTRDNPR